MTANKEELIRALELVWGMAIGISAEFKGREDEYLKARSNTINTVADVIMNGPRPEADGTPD